MITAKNPFKHIQFLFKKELFPESVKCHIIEILDTLIKMWSESDKEIPC